MTQSDEKPHHKTVTYDTRTHRVVNTVLTTKQIMDMRTAMKKHYERLKAEGQKLPKKLTDSTKFQIRHDAMLAAAPEHEKTE